MAAATVTVKRGDTGRILTDALLFGGAPLDLTLKTVQIVIKDLATGLSTKSNATIVTPLEGTVKYALTAPQVAVAGSFLIEWEVTQAGNVLTVPDNEYHRLEIVPDLA
jgi:hypothetical protein